MTKRKRKNKFLSGNWYPVEETSTTELKLQVNYLENYQVYFSETDLIQKNQ